MHSTATSDSTPRSTDTRATTISCAMTPTPHPSCRAASPSRPPSTGTTTGHRRRRGPTPSSMRPMCAVSPCTIRESPRICAVPTPGSLIPRSSTTWSVSASPRSSSCPRITTSTSLTCSSSASRTTGDTTRWGSSRRTRSTPRAARAESRCASSRKWSARSTRRASRSSSTSSTTTRPRAMNSVRRCPSAGFATPATTGSATAATTWTTRVAETPLTSPIHTSCRWSWIHCATG